MSKTLFKFGTCSMSFSQELMNYCTGLLLDGIHNLSPLANKTPEQLWILGMVGNRQEEICLEQVSN